MTTRTDVPTQPASDDEALLAYVRDRDVECPVCRYNLRDLPRPVCPECEQPLALRVGARERLLGWYLSLIAPSIFSGIAAVLLGVPVAYAVITNRGTPPAEIVVVDVFGILSGLVGVALFLKRYRVLRWRVGVFRRAVAVSWTIHLAMFIWFLAMLFS